MNFRNKYLSNTIRILFGLLMLFSGISGLMAGQSTENVPPQTIEIFQALWKSGILQMIKATEATAGFMLLINFLPALAAIFIAPIAIGIIIVNSILTPEYLFIGIVVALLNAYLGYVYWDKYKKLFTKS